eukprot:gene4397-5146_t
MEQVIPSGLGFVKIRSTPNWGYTYLAQPPEFPQKEVGQKFINFGFEHEEYFPIQMEPGYVRHLDANSTYRQSSEVHITFTCSWGMGANGHIDNFKEAQVKPFSAKEKAIGFMSSNCGGGGAIYRTEYIKELMKLLKVDGLGECLHTKDLDPEDSIPVFGDLGKSMSIKERILSKYMFSFAFENNNKTDYVSEKVYTSLLSGSLPLYMGAPNIDEYVPRNSIIKTDSFKSASDLAKYLKYLMGNETAYNEYFEWKTEPYPQSFIDKYNKCIFYQGDCAICQYIHKLLDEDKNKNLSQGHRVDFGEPEDVRIKTQVLQMTHNSCMKILWFESIKSEFTFMAWINPEGASTQRIFEIGSGALTVSVAQVWKRFYLQMCYMEECLLGETPISNGICTLSTLEVGRTMFKKLRGDEKGLGAYFTFNGDQPTDYSIFRSGVQASNVQIKDSSLRKLELGCC